MTTLLKKNMLMFMACMMVIMPFASVAFGSDTQVFVDNDNRAVAMTADIIVVRPLSLAATIVGTVVFVIAVPFAALGGNTREAFDHLMVKPALYTFKRPLGQFE